jgi:putative FmdB family regulatory protein
MPTYDYRCKKCNHVFEKSVSMKDDLLPTKDPCPACNKSGEIVKEISAPGLNSGDTLGLKKPDAGFREVLAKIKEKHPGHRINDRW